MVSAKQTGRRSPAFRGDYPGSRPAAAEVSFPCTWARIFSMTAGSSMQARACPASAASALGITFTVPPHSRQVSMSISPKAPTFGEHTFQVLRPAHREGETGTRSRGWPGPCPSLGGGLLLVLVGGFGLVAPTPLGRRHQRTAFAVRGKDTVETRQVTESRD